MHDSSASTAPYWLAFGDIHDNRDRFATFSQLGRAVGILLTGDLTFNGGTEAAWRVLEPLAKATPALLAQPGNMDRPGVEALLEEKGWNLHAKARELFHGVYAFGLGYSPPTPFHTPGEFPESRLAEWLDQGFAAARALAEAAKVERPVFVLVSHTPPYGTACDKLHSGTSVGSPAVRDFIEKNQPDLCLCGHIHESRAEDRLGMTFILNPGDFASGGYIELRLGQEADGPRLEAVLRILS